MLFSEESPVISSLSSPEDGEKASTMEMGEAVPVHLSADDTEISNTTLSTRAKNALEKNGIASLNALKALGPEQIENIDGLGKKTISEILEYLAK